jgi:hypothetical protein
MGEKDRKCTDCVHNGTEICLATVRVKESEIEKLDEDNPTCDYFDGGDIF